MAIFNHMTGLKWAAVLWIGMAAAAAFASEGSSTAPASQAATAGFPAYRKAATASLESQYAEIVQRLAGSPEMAAFQERLTAIDEAVSKIDDGLQSVQALSMDDLLMDLSRAPRSSPPLRYTAEELVANYGPKFTGVLPRPAVSDQELAVIVGYYNGVLRAAAEYVNSRGAVTCALDDYSMAGATRFCLVLPLLHFSDEEWSDPIIDQLPAWMRTAEGLRICESLSLECRRPLTAYHFAMRHPGKTHGQDPPPDYLSYLKDIVCIKTLAENYRDEIFFLQAAIAASEKQGQTTEPLRFELAEAYKKIHQLVLAAAEYDRVWKDCPTSANRGRAAMERCLCLYQAKVLEPIPVEFERYCSDPQCKDYLAEIIYVTWLTCRKLNKTEQAESLQKLFLQKFPDHPLGADIRFAAAMTALVSNDYQEASQQLDAIEAKYPDSRLMPKVKEIQSRIQNALKSTGANGTKVQ